MFSTQYTGVQLSGVRCAIVGSTQWLTNSQFSTLNSQFVKDHLGSPRVVFEPSGTTTKVTQINAYYPFGMIIQGLSYNAVGSTNRYHREGKEFISDFGHNRLDYLNRTYNPATGLFDQNDQLSEKFSWMSPKAFCGNNPIRNIDPDGRDWYSYQSTYTYTNKNGDEEIRSRTMYKYTTEHRSQKDLDKAGIDGKYLGKVHFSQDTYFRLEGGTTSTRDFETTFNAIAEDFSKMSSKDVRANQSKAETYFSTVNWNENLPTSFAAFGNIYAVSTSKNTYVNLTDKSLKREFDKAYKEQLNYPSYGGFYLSPVSDMRTFAGLMGMSVSIIKPYSLFFLKTPSTSEVFNSATNSYYRTLLRYYKKYNIIK